MNELCTGGAARTSMARSFVMEKLSLPVVVGTGTMFLLVTQSPCCGWRPSSSTFACGKDATMPQNDATNVSFKKPVMIFNSYSQVYSSVCLS
jgi:hypothetical protein